MLKFLTTTEIAAIAMPAVAFAQAPRLSLDIKASDTATGLNSFARQAGVHVIFPHGAVANRRVAASRGRFIRAEALRRLIAGQGLTIAEEGVTMVSLKVAPVETPDIAAEATTPDGQDIVVLGRGHSCQAQAVSATAM